MSEKKKETHAPEEEILVLHEKWVEAARRHLREIIIAALALIFLASLWSAYNYFRHKRLENATLLYAQALMVKDEEQKIKLLREVIKKYGGTTTALEARLTLAEMYLEEGRVKEAEEELRKALEDAEGPLEISMTMGLGYFAEDQARLEEAARRYQKGASARLGFEEVAYLDLARVEELRGDYEKAIKCYREVISLNPPEAKLDFLQVKLSRLVEKLGRGLKEGEG